MRYQFCLVLILCLWISGINSSLPCCDGNNTVIGKNCTTGQKPKIPCPRGVYLVHENIDNFIQTLSTNEYCAFQFEGVSHESYLVCFPEDQSEHQWHFQIYPILELCSVVFIVITIIIYASLPKILDIQGIITLHAITGLGIAYITLSINQLQPQFIGIVCTMSAYTLYFSSLYAFFWLNTLSFNIWRTSVQPKFLPTTKNWLLWYHISSIGFPIFLLIVILIGHQTGIDSSLHPGFGNGRCWFKNTESEILYFYIPITILFGLNILYFGWTIVALWKDVSRCDEKSIKILKFRTKLCLKLFIIMGVPWIFEVISGVFSNVHYVMKIWWVIMDCINCLQGILIFLVLVVFRKKVVRELAAKTCCGKRFPSHWKTLQDDECDDIIEEFIMGEPSNKI